MNESNHPAPQAVARAALRQALSDLADSHHGTPTEDLLREAYAALAPQAVQVVPEQARLQGGLSNEELREAWDRKLPGVEPQGQELSAFALGVEVGDEPARVYFAERNSARDAWWRRVKKCEALQAENAKLRQDAERYRWLVTNATRAAAGTDMNPGFVRVERTFWSAGRELIGFTPSLDTAIDAALATEASASNEGTHG